MTNAHDSVVLMKKKAFHWILTLLLLLTSLALFVFEAREQFYKFIAGQTTMAVEKQHYDALELPEVTICMESAFKKTALESEGLPERFFLTTDSTFGNNGTDPFPDLRALWDKTTYSERELEITWRLYQRKILQRNSCSHSQGFKDEDLGNSPGW